MLGLLIAGLIISTSAQARGSSPGPDLMVQWKGDAFPATLPANVGGDTVPEGSECFKVTMTNPNTGFEIGNGYDCITNLGSFVDTGEGTITTRYIFVFTDGSSIVTENRVIAKQVEDNDPLNPIPAGGESANGNSTHSIGGFPSNNTIIDGFQRFSKASGRVTVFGAPNLSFLPGKIVFDHLFLVEFN